MRRHLPDDIADRPGVLAACLVFALITLAFGPLYLIGLDVARRPIEWAARRVMKRLGVEETDDELHPEFDTDHLAYDDISGLISLKNDDGEDIPLGVPGDPSDCPPEYLAEWREIQQLLADAEEDGRAYDATRRAADYDRHAPERW